MTLTELIRDIESRQLAAQRRESDATMKIKRLVGLAEAEGRKSFTEAEEKQVDQWTAAKRAASDELKRLEGELVTARQIKAEDAENDRLSRIVIPTGAGRAADRTNEDGERPLIRLSDGRPAAVQRGQAFRDHPVVSEYAAATSAREQAVIGHHGSLGQMLRAMTTTSGSALVPTVWASDIIDRARNVAAVLKAGAQVVPMDAKTVNIGRLTTDPTAGFRAEGSTVTASDPVFDNVTLTSKTLSALVVGSMEWFMDAPNVDEVVSDAIANAVALTLDQQALFGGITTGGETGATAFNTTFPNPPNPTGVLANLLANASSSVLGGAANGTSQTAATFWNEIIDTIWQPRLFNEEPNALLWSPTQAKFYAKVYDTTNQPLQVPPSVQAVPQFMTAQIPASFTQGTSTTNMSDVFVGDWTQLIIGQRLDFTVQTLVERYAELGQVGIIAHWRGDVGLTRPRAFSVYRYLKSN
jgi:HK97 family phage major capsid protein